MTTPHSSFAIRSILFAALLTAGAGCAQASLPHHWRGPFTDPSLGAVPVSVRKAEPVPPAQLKPVLKLPPPLILGRALAAMVRQGDHRGLLFVVDMSLPNIDPRLWVIDTRGEQLRVLMRTQVAHGIGSDPHRTGMAHAFSNVPNSYMTSLGAYRVGQQYQGHSGLAYHLLGLSATDSNAEERDIELHRADYVSPTRVGWSQGCLAVSPAALTAMVKRFGDLSGALVYVGVGQRRLRSSSTDDVAMSTF